MMKIEVLELKELDNGDCEVMIDMDDEAQKVIIQVGFIKILEDTIKKSEETE